MSGNVQFLAGTTLDFKEFLEVHQDRVERYKYAYNYREGKRSIFRYDNAPDPRAKPLPTYPAHKHEGERLVTSGPVDLPVVIGEILQGLVDRP